jgi:hypothetical protein
MGVTVTVRGETRPGSVTGTLTLADVPVAITLRDRQISRQIARRG